MNLRTQLEVVHSNLITLSRQHPEAATMLRRAMADLDSAKSHIRRAEKQMGVKA